MPFITERTNRAHGTVHKGGAIRRIAVTMDERLFLDLKGYALSEGRTISDAAARAIAQTLRQKPKAKTA
jgi:hypothetical protein